MSSGMLFSFKREGNTAIFDKMDEPGEDYTKWNKPDTERQKPHGFIYMKFLKESN